MFKIIKDHCDFIDVFTYICCGLITCSTTFNVVGSNPHMDITLFVSGCKPTL